MMRLSLALEQSGILAGPEWAVEVSGILDKASESLVFGDDLQLLQRLSAQLRVHLMWKWTFKKYIINYNVDKKEHLFYLKILNLIFGGQELFIKKHKEYLHLEKKENSNSRSSPMALPLWVI